MVKKSQIKYYKKLPSNLNYFIFCDPAVSQESYSDYTAFVVVAIDPEESWYVVEATQDKFTVSQMIDKMFFLHGKYQPSAMGIEVIGLGQTLMAAINSEETRRQTYLPLTPIKSQQGTKEVRIRSTIQPKFERGSVLLRRGLDELEDQLLTFPNSKHDDIIDALACIEQIGYPPDKDVLADKQEPPKDPLARRIWEKINRQRTPVDPVLGEFY